MCLEEYGGRLSLFMFVALELSNCTLILKIEYLPQGIIPHLRLHSQYIHVCSQAIDVTGNANFIYKATFPLETLEKSFCLSYNLVPLSLKLFCEYFP